MWQGNERGEGKLSNLFWLVVLAAGAYAGWHAIPPFVSNYTLKDQMVEVCRVPRYRYNDDKIMDLLMKEVQERDLTDYITRNSFRVVTSEHNRRISLDYYREIEILPGWKRVVHFTEQVEQPLL
jgi:hypothetical protein